MSRTASAPTPAPKRGRDFRSISEQASRKAHGPGRARRCARRVATTYPRFYSARWKPSVLAQFLRKHAALQKSIWGLKLYMHPCLAKISCCSATPLNDRTTPRLRFSGGPHGAGRWARTRSRAGAPRTKADGNSSVGVIGACLEFWLQGMRVWMFRFFGVQGLLGGMRVP